MRLENRGGDGCHPSDMYSAWLGSLGMWGAPSIPSMWDVGQNTVDWLWPRYVGAVRLIDAANAAAMPEYEAISGAPEPFPSSCGGGLSDGSGVVLRAIYTTDPKWALHGFSALLGRAGVASSIVLSSDLTGTVPPLGPQRRTYAASWRPACGWPATGASGGPTRAAPRLRPMGRGASPTLINCPFAVALLRGLVNTPIALLFRFC